MVPNDTTQGWVCLVIPQLIWMYKCKSLAKLLTWHKDGASLDGMISNVLDSMIWNHIDKNWFEFVSDVCNIRLRLAFDEANPFGDLSSCHSTWVAVLLNYSLLPWLVIRRYFLMLPWSSTTSNVDVYLGCSLFFMSVCIGGECVSRKHGPPSPIK